MKMKLTQASPITTGTLALAGLLALATPRTQAAETKTDRNVGISKRVVVNDDGDPDKNIVIKKIKDQDDDAAPAKDHAWLGVAIEEASETLGEQLGLDAGVGLVVTHVSVDSPAAKAGLKKNDVLVELAEQSLVHPAQLRKLVQAREPGDKVKLVFYRGGKKQTESATLEKAPVRFGLFDDGGKSSEDMQHLELALRELRGLPGAASAAVHVQTKALHDALRNISGPQKEQIEVEIKRGMEQARRAIEEAARELEHNKGSLQKESARLKELLKSGVSVDDNATVVVRSKGKSSRSLVKTDDTGTIILVGPPDLRLTARDKNGRLLFDGEIDTDQQRAKVPRDLWERVGPLIHKESVEPVESRKKEPASTP
jgi:hypothetical protein